MLITYNIYLLENICYVQRIEAVAIMHHLQFYNFVVGNTKVWSQVN